MENKNNSNKNIDIDSKLLFSSFNSKIQLFINDCWSETNNILHLEKIESSSIEVTKLITKIGNYCNYILNENINDIEPSNYFVIYHWSDLAKKFTIVWRDILFQQTKAYIKLQEGLITETSYNKLKEKSKVLVLDLSKKLDYELKKEEFSNKDINDWKKQKNPWKIYSQQIKLIPDHCEVILNQFQLLRSSLNLYSQIYSNFKTNISDYIKKIESFIERVENDFKINDDKDLNYQSFMSFLYEIQKNELSFSSLFDLKSKLITHTSKLPKKQKFFLDVKDGHLLFKELDIVKATNSWLETEVMIFIYDFYNIKKDLYNNIELNILNTKNIIEFKRKDKIAFSGTDLNILLDSLLQVLYKSKEDMTNIENKVFSLLDDQLKISNIFKNGFLHSSINIALSEYNKYQEKSIKSFKSSVFYKNYIYSIFKNKSSEKESSFRKLSDVVTYRTPELENSNYTNMFLTKGYIGDSFFVGRQKELIHIENLINKWKSGYRGSLLITGERFSGKSFLGSLINNFYFEGKGVELYPMKRFYISGRYFDTKNDLLEALNFIIKYHSQEKIIVFIDDLTHWISKDIELLENFKLLFKMIDQFSGKIFFTVSISSILKEKLKPYFDISKYFQSEINISKMEFKDVKRAIMIRHNATQNNLVDSRGRTYDKQKLDRLIKNIYKSSKGNVGESLIKWSYIMQRYNNVSVFPKQKYKDKVPYFFDQESILLLRQILLYEKTNEFLLSNKFGFYFKETFKFTLQRLFNLGALKRQMDGSLEINPFLVNEISFLINEKHNIR